MRDRATERDDDQISITTALGSVQNSRL